MDYFAHGFIIRKVRLYNGNTVHPIVKAGAFTVNRPRALLVKSFVLPGRRYDSRPANAGLPVGRKYVSFT